MPTALNPVALITGAASKIGADCARALAGKATGGLILIDSDEDALAAAADALPAAPERVSTLNFEVANASRWKQATNFIDAQYGRLDWALVNSDPTNPKLDGILQSLRVLMPLLRRNRDGGAILVTGAAAATSVEAELGVFGAPKPGLLQVVRAAAKEGARDLVRVNALALGGLDAAMWREAPLFQDLVRETGSERAAIEHLGQLAAPFARYDGSDDIARLIALLFTDSTTLTGAALVVEGGFAL